MIRLYVYDYNIRVPFLSFPFSSKSGIKNIPPWTPRVNFKLSEIEAKQKKILIYVLYL